MFNDDLMLNSGHYLSYIGNSKDALFYRRHDTLSAPSGALQLLGGEVAWLYGISLEAIIKN